MDNAPLFTKTIGLCTVALVFLLFLPFVFSVTNINYDYRIRGFEDLSYMDKAGINDHNQDTLFNSSTSAYSLYTAQNSNPVTTTESFAPIWTDLNDDGENFLITSNLEYIRVFQNKTLNQVQIFSLVNCTRILKLDVYKYDQNYLLVSYLNGSMPYVNAYIWNGTAFNLNVKYRAGLSAYTDSYGLNCDNNKICFDSYRATGICSAFMNLETLETHAEPCHVVGANTAMPKINNMPYGDINSDGFNEFLVMSYSAAGSTGIAYVTHFSYNSSNITEYNSYDLVTSNSFTFSGYMTSALLGYFTPISSNSLVFAFPDVTNAAGEKIKLYAFYWSGSDYVKYGEYPGLYDVGYLSLVSNIFTAKIIENGAYYDFCVIGYPYTSNNTVLLCANAHDLPLGESQTRIYMLDNTTESIYNSNPSYWNAHSLKTKNADTDVLLMNGLYKTEDSILTYLTGIGELKKTFINPQTSTALIPISLDGSPYYDLLGYTSLGLYYIDDNSQSAINFNPKINLTGISPCRTEVWKTNTTVNLKFNIGSYNDFYPISYRSYFYYGSPYQQFYNWSPQIGSPQKISIQFIANVTTTIPEVLRVELKDSNDRTAIFEHTYSVSPLGVTSDQCQESNIIDSSLVQNTTSPYYQNATIQNNGWKTAIYTAANYINIPVILLFLAFLFVLDVVLFVMSLTTPHLQDRTHAVLIFILMVDIFAIVIGTYLDIVPIALVISLILIFIIIAALFLSQKFNRSSGG